MPVPVLAPALVRHIALTLVIIGRFPRSDHEARGVGGDDDDNNNGLIGLTDLSSLYR